MYLTYSKKKEGSKIVPNYLYYEVNNNKFNLIKLSLDGDKPSLVDNVRNLLAKYPDDSETVNMNFYPTLPAYECLQI